MLTYFFKGMDMFQLRILCTGRFVFFLLSLVFFVLSPCFGSPMDEISPVKPEAMSLKDFSFSVQPDYETLSAQTAEKKLAQGQFRQALAFAEKAIFKQPEDPAGYGVAGVVLAFTGQKESAKARMDFLKDHPGDGFYLNLIQAILNAQDGKIHAAEQSLSICLKPRPDHPFTNYYKGSLSLAKKDYEIAISYFEAVLAREGGFVPALAGAGQAHLKLDHLNEAIALYEAAVKIEPENLLHRRQLLSLYKKSGKHILAQQQTREILYFIPGVKSNYLQKGQQLLLSGDYEAAKALMDKIIPVYKNIPIAFYIKAAAAANLGEKDRAEENIENFLISQNNNPLAYHYSGMCCLALGLYEKAQAHFTKVISLNPNFGKSFIPLTIIEQLNGNFPRALAGLELAEQMGEPKALIAYLSAHIYLEQGNMPVFLKKMEDAAKLIPGLGECSENLLPGKNDKGFYARKRNLMSLFFFNGWYGKALEISRQLLEVNGKDRFALYYKALCETVQNKPEAAIRSYRSLLQIDNRIYSAQLGLGRLYLKQGDIEKASLLFNRAIEINPELGSAYLNLGNIHSLRQEYAKALDSYLKALENNAGELAVYPKLIMLLVEDDKNLSKAAFYCEKLEALSPNDPYSLDALGWANLKFNKREKALGMIQKAYSMVPHDPVILYHLGVAHYETNNQDAARKFLKAATEKSAVFPGYECAISILSKLNAAPE